MPTLKLTSEQWRNFGQPDLGNKIYLKNKETKKREYFEVIMSDFKGTKKDPRIKLKIARI
jgi:hypothetical protein